MGNFPLFETGQNFKNTYKLFLNKLNEERKQSFRWVSKGFGGRKKKYMEIDTTDQ